jgi:hypothetical protein
MMRSRFVRYCTLSEVRNYSGVQEMGTRNRSEMVAVRGSPCAPIPLILILNGVLTDFQSTYLNITHQNATCKASLSYLIVFY